MANLLGLEIGGTKLQLGLGDGAGRVDRWARLPVDPAAGAAGILAQIAGAARALGAAPDAIGVGFGGPIDADRGVVVRSHQVEGWDGFPLADWCRRGLGAGAVSVRNDSDAAALGEARFGAGEGLSPVLYVNSGSGVGGGLVVDGRIYRGCGLGAVEVGHLLLADPAGGASSLEGLASGWAIGRAGRAAVERLGRVGASAPLVDLCGGEPARVTGVVVADAARLGDVEAFRILETATTAMGQALAHAVTLLAPRRVILGGGVAQVGEALWLGPIRRVLEARVFPPFRGTFDVVAARLGQDVVVHGALALARDAMA